LGQTWEPWHRSGAGGGGQSDILWRNTGTRNTIIWQMNGFTKQVTGSIGANISAWQLRC
jgi:hypothetical protein